MQSLNFDILIHYLSGEATPEEALYVEDWRNADPAHAAFFDELAVAWHDDLSYRKPDIVRMWQDFQDRNTTGRIALPTRKKRRLMVWSAAAVLLLLTATAGFVFLFHKPEPLRFYASDRITQIILPDSTRVDLHPSAVLSYIENAKTGRRLTLKGDATFEIVRHQSPLVAELENGLHIKDIGTRFHIIQKNKTAEVTVYSGKVAAYFQSDTVYASARQIITVDAGSKSLQQEDMKGRFSFKDEPVSDIVQQLSGHFHTSIFIKDSTIAAQRITITANAETFDTWMQILSAQLETNYYQDEKGNFIME